jgi:eukaryotic-like serine/threonine-protein kinase
MTTDRWHRISSLYHAALARPRDERPAYLRDVCAGDESLQGEIESLLAADGEVAIVDTPALEGAARALAADRPSLVGRRLGAYQVTACLGTGGMGEVYRAHDARLGRDVAIKVSREIFSERFAREAHAIASLNHPNICTLHDVGPDYLVMELVEGESPRGPLPLATVIVYARQIANALEAAHEKGVVHRDLKPANIKITPSGIVKVLDFGLAKTELPPAAVPDSPAAISVTATGAILGTASYMSPEQAKGKPVDKRTDIWAFGVVLYELLTGRRPFVGESIHETVAAVLKEEPDLNRVPAQVRPLLRRCLDKDPKRRLRDIGDAMPLLEEPTPSEMLRRRSALFWPGVATLLAIVGAVVWWATARTPPIPEITRFQIAPPDNDDFGLALSVSPDGRKLAFMGQTPDGRGRLWVRDFDSVTSRPLPGTENESGGSPFWSPDSRFIAFSDGNKLKRIDASGSAPPETITEIRSVIRAGNTTASPSPSLGLGSWGREGVILIGSRRAGPIWRVPEAGGDPTAVTAVDPKRLLNVHGLPFFLPDGRHFIYFKVGSEDSQGIYVGSADAKPENQPSQRLLASASQAIYVASPDSHIGQLLFMREGRLLAQSFDANRLAITGDAFPVAEQVGQTGAYGFFSAVDGVLAYRAGREYQLTWFDRQGQPLGQMSEPANTGFVSISPDGSRHVLARLDLDKGNFDIWLTELARGVTTRVTFDPANDSFPLWSPDGSRMVFSSDRSGVLDLYRKELNGGDRDDLLLHTGKNKWPSDWSHNGRYVIYEELDGEGKEDLWVLPLDGTSKPFVWIRSPFRENLAQFSPDDRWIAYQSNESGRLEVYVRPFMSPETGAPAPAGSYLVSKDGGARPVWRRDGRELIYVGPNRMLTAVDVTADLRFQTGSPRTLFRLPALTDVIHFALHPDGQRFLIPAPAAGDGRSPITIVMNWQTALKR